MSDLPLSNKVFHITDIDEFISSIRMECVKDILSGLSTTFYKTPGKFKKILDKDEIVESLLPSSVIEAEIEKYIFSTTLHEDDVFIRPEHIDIIIRDVTIDTFDSVMMKLADYGILEICWYKEDFMWRIKPLKAV